MKNNNQTSTEKIEVTGTDATSTDKIFEKNSSFHVK